MKVRTRRRRALGNAAIFLGLMALGWALVRPGLDARERNDRHRDAQEAVAAVRLAMESHLREEGRYPAGAAAGTMPEELVSYLPSGVAFATPHFTLDVQRWSRVERPPIPAGFDPQDSIPVPQPYRVEAGALAVTSGDSVLLAVLLERFGRATSFVRDTTWTLLLEEAPLDPSGPGTNAGR